MVHKPGTSKRATRQRAAGSAAALFNHLQPFNHELISPSGYEYTLLLVEAFGGVASGGARLLRFLSRRATDKKRGRDGTKYSKFHPSNYLAHHLASISLAAVYTDAVHIEEGIDGLKQRALALAPCDSE